MKVSSLIFIISLLLVTCLLYTINPIQAQQPNRPQGSVTINTDLVVTWAQVTNRTDGSPINGLGIDDFLLREEGKQQQIDLVKEGQPLSVVILVDGQRCVWPPEIEFRRSREALRRLGEDAEIALMAWDSDVRLVQPLTTDQNVIANRLEDGLFFFQALNGPQKVPRPNRGPGRPGEAIYQAARYLEKVAAPERRKIIIVITQSWYLMAQKHLHTGGEGEELLKKTGTTVYALLENIGKRRTPINPWDWVGRKLEDRLRNAGGTLEKFVDLTGGLILVSKNEAWLNDATLTPNGEFGKEFDELFIKLTTMIRSSYTIGYYPEDSNFDGRFRRINLELSRSGKAKAGKADVKSRGGYYALRPSSPTFSEVKN